MPADARDERSLHLRRLRRSRGSARRWTVTAGGLTAAAAVLVPYQGLGPVDAVWAALAGGSVVMAWLRWSDTRALAAAPVPDPPDPAYATDRWLGLLAQVPGAYPLAEHLRRQRIRTGLRGTGATEPWERLERAAGTIRELSGRLRSADPEAGAQATRVERELRELTDRVVGLSRALRSAPPDAREPLRELRDDHVRHLAHAVDGYEQFVVAAASYVSESGRIGELGPAGTAPPVTSGDGLARATERLRGVAGGLAELRRAYGDLRPPPTPSI